MSADREERALKEAIARAVAGTGFVDRERLGFNAGYRAALAWTITRIRSVLEADDIGTNRAERLACLIAAALVASPTPEGETTVFEFAEDEDSNGTPITLGREQGTGAVWTAGGSLPDTMRRLAEKIELAAGSSTPEADEGRPYPCVFQSEPRRTPCKVDCKCAEKAAAAGVPGETAEMRVETGSD